MMAPVHSIRLTGSSWTWLLKKGSGELAGSLRARIDSTEARQVAATQIREFFPAFETLTLVRRFNLPPGISTQRMELNVKLNGLPIRRFSFNRENFKTDVRNFRVPVPLGSGLQELGLEIDRMDFAVLLSGEWEIDVNLEIIS